MRNLSPSGRVHCVGIGGIGLSALARWYLAHGWEVSGSDSSTSELTEELRKAGVQIFNRHSAKNLQPATTLVIHSQAIPFNNPEIVAARRRNLPVQSYPEAIGELSRQYRTLAISGAHGKSTTTGLLSLILVRAGLDPTVILGTKLPQFGNSNFRSGENDLLVLEADEYGKAFLHYSPADLIITNLDREHLDTYRNLRDIQTTFLKLVRKLPIGGHAILNQDDPPLLELRSALNKISAKKNIKLHWYSLKNKEAAIIRKVLNVPGLHNLSNALAAYFMAKKVFQLPERVILDGLERYRGAWRRMQYRGLFGGARIYDDYGHHPTEIRATLLAFREKFPRKKIMCVFEPHQAERLTLLFEDFQTAFENASAILILPAFRVPGRDQRRKGRSSADLVRAIQKHQPGRPISYLSQPEQLPQALSALGNLSDWVIVMMGAGTINQWTDRLIQGPTNFRQSPLRAPMKP